jgi:hypothetical protein
MDDASQPQKLTCPQCDSRLAVVGTQSGARIVLVAILGFSVETIAKGLEGVVDAGAGPEIKCPACESWIDPSGVPGMRG